MSLLSFEMEIKKVHRVEVTIGSNICNNRKLLTVTFVIRYCYQKLFLCNHVITTKIIKKVVPSGIEPLILALLAPRLNQLGQGT